MDKITLAAFRRSRAAAEEVAQAFELLVEMRLRMPYAPDREIALRTLLRGWSHHEEVQAALNKFFKKVSPRSLTVHYRSVDPEEEKERAIFEVQRALREAHVKLGI